MDTLRSETLPPPFTRHRAQLPFPEEGTQSSPSDCYEVTRSPSRIIPISRLV
jgi:hypothetical protein